MEIRFREITYKENVYHNLNFGKISEDVTLLRESFDFILTEEIIQQNRSKIYFTEQTRDLNGRLNPVYNFQEKYLQFKMIANTFRLINTA
jgi:hypothetical protein